MIRIALVGLVCCGVAVTGNNVVLACTAFCAAGAGQVLVGNNEDWDNPHTQIWFVPAKPGSYGRVYVGFADLTRFPKNTAADTFAARRTNEDGPPGRAFAIVSLVLFCSVVILSGYGLARANRRVRVGVAVLVGIAVVGVVATVVAVHMQPNASRDWMQFSIGPASGMRGGSMADLASALQSILGRPVIDETGIAGSYNAEFAWGEDRVASVTAALGDRFGLRLTSDARDMDALIVDRIRRDPALVLLAQVGRLTRAAPPRVREQIANVLTMR